MVVKLGARQVVLTPPDWKWTGNVDGDSFLKNGDVVYVKVEGVGADGALTCVAAAGLGRAGFDDGGGQCERRGAGDGGRTGLRAVAVQSGDAGAAAGGLVVQAVCVYDGGGGGAKPTDLIVDGPTTFPTPNGPYTPHNYEGDYKGTMTLLDAFKESRNIPALKLADRVGIRKVIEMAHRFGVTSNIPAFLPIAIGAADITLV